MTTKEIQEEIINEFKPLDNLMDKYIHLVKLGKSLPSKAQEFKTETNLIKGCQLTTWFCSTFADGKVYFEIDSSSVIIKGAVSLLIRILSGQRPEEIKNANLFFIEKIGLQEIFSPIRSNSLWKVENLIKSEATAREAGV